MGYHIANIQKGVLGEISKIQEELDELKDANSQQAKIMELCELADILGAIKAYLQNHHPNFTIEDCIKMANLTESAFREGRRK